MAVLFTPGARDTDVTRDPRRRLAALHTSRPRHAAPPSTPLAIPGTTPPPPRSIPPPQPSTSSPPPSAPPHSTSAPPARPPEVEPPDDGTTAFTAYLNDLHRYGHDPLGIAQLDCWPHPGRHRALATTTGPNHTPTPSSASHDLSPDLDPTTLDLADLGRPPGVRPGEPAHLDPEDLDLPDPAGDLGHAGPAAVDPGRSTSGPRRFTAVAGRGAGRLVRRWLPDGAGTDRPGGPRPMVGRLGIGRRQVLALAAVVLLAAVVAMSLVWRSRPVAETAPRLAPVAHETPAAESLDLVVSIAGPVVTPGLVRLKPGARVADALAAVGGAVPGTDLTGVNLARRLTDGEHVVIGPTAAAGGSAPAGPAASGRPPLAATPAGSGARLDLNTATLAELDTLPGVGPVTAQRILDWRAEHGRFASVDQLREIDGIGETRFAKLKDLVLA